MADLTFSVGDTAPSVYGTLTVAGVAVNLTGCTVKFQMRTTTALAHKVDATAVILSPTAGTVRYDWAAGDLDTAGDYVSTWEITYADLTVTHTEPLNTITVVQA